MPNTMPNKIDVEICRMGLDELHPADYNPRTISDEAYVGLSKSMDKFGILAHIVWNKHTGNIVGGHQRFRHLLESGVKETDVIVVDLDENDEVALNITLNNPKIRGDFTSEILEQLQDVQSLDEDFHELCLDDLYDDLKKKNKKKKEIKEDDSSSAIVNEETEVDEIEDNEENDGSIAVITCPECGAQWSLETKEIISTGLNEGKKFEDLEEKGIV